MIINSQSDKQIAIVGGESKKATINPDEIAKLQYLLTKGLYTDPIGAVITEWTNNAVDSVVQSGKDPIQVPVIVEIGRNESGSHFLRVSDKGTGLDKETFQNVCMSYLTSTKTHSNDYIGSFGIGMKSFLSLDRNAIFTCRKDGMEYKFNVYQGVEFVEFDLLYEGPTTEENGVICELPIKDWSEYSQFKQKATKKLAYYDTVLLFLDNSETPVENVISRSELFQWSNLIGYNVPMHMSLKDVYYEIDFTKLEIPTLYFPVCLRFSLEDGISPTPSREGIIYNDETKKLILERIQKVADFFVGLFNTDQEEADPEVNPEKALQYIEKSKEKDFYVEYSGKTFKINDISKYSTLERNRFSLKGVNLRKLSFYKEKLSYMKLGVTSYRETESYSGFRRAGLTTPITALLNGVTVVLVDPTHCKNRLLAFLKEKYGDTDHILFVSKDDSKPRLRSKIQVYSAFTYYGFLELKDVPKAQWRDHIKEFQYIENCLAKLIHDETEAHLSQEYLEYVEANKQPVVNTPYKKLNKQEGDLTYHFFDLYSSRKYKLGSKKVIKIADIQKSPILFVKVDEKDEEKAAKMQKSLHKSPVLFVLVGPRESKKIPEVHNFITMDQFIKTSKVFKRWVTGMRINNLLDSYSDTGIRNVEKLVDGTPELLKELKEYRRLNYSDYIDSDIQKEMLSIAESLNLWDTEHIHKVVELEKRLKEYDFLTVLPKDTDSKLLNKFVAEIKMFRKLHKGLFDEYDIVKREPIIEVKEEPAQEEDESELVEVIVDNDFPF